MKQIDQLTISKKMKKSIYSIALLLLAIVTLPFYGNGQTVSREREIKEFSKIVISGTIRSELLQGDSSSVIIIAEPEEQDAVKTESKNGTLKVSSVKGSEAVVLITAVDLTEISLSETSEIEGKSKFITEDLTIICKGASKIKIDLKATNLKTELSGASAATITGTTDHHNLKMRGASSGNFESLITGTAVVDVTGATNATVNVSDKIEGRVAGMSSIKLASQPETNLLEVSSIGSITVTEESIEVVIDLKDDNNNDKTDKNEKTRKSRSNNFKGHFSGLELGINTFVDKNNKFKLPEGAEYLELKIPNSLTLNFNLLQGNLPIIGQNLGLVTGLGLEFNDYKFSGNNYIQKKDGEIIGVPAPDDIDFDMSKLSCTYLKVPFLLEFQTKSGSSSNQFYLSAGVNFGLRIASHTQYNYKHENLKVKKKYRGNHYLNPFRVAPTLRLGWGPLSFFAEYNMLPLFESGKGPEVHSVSLGVALFYFNN